jgi:N-acetylglucosamine-6-phosphate deacetylase
MIIKSKRIVCEDKILEGYLVVENGKIVAIKEGNENIVEDIDCGNNRIIPGIFDTHNHGTQGYGLLNSTSEEEVKCYLKGLASQGVTSIFPTCSVNLISKISKMMKAEQDGAKIVGIHSEGPWLNRVGEKGTKTGWPEVDINTAEKMIEGGEGNLKLVALAPEIPGIYEVIKLFIDNGVKVAVAHSDMNYSQANEAIEKGVTVATHLSNVMTGLHHRDIGVFGACLLDNRVDCELICDGMHVSLPMVKLILRAKNNKQIMMISDCTTMSGAPVGKYKGFGPGMEVINVDEKGFVFSDEGRLCGSSQGILFGIYNLVEKLNISIEEVVKLSSLNACRVYGLDSHKGSIRVGKDADFVIISDDYKVIQTYSEGRKVFDADIDKDIFNPEFYVGNIIK